MVVQGRRANIWDALVIGAGFFGAEIALELRRLGLRRVLVAEREPGIMRRASYVNQARIHHGYHYPRSLVTAERSRANFEAFVAEYAGAVLPGMEHVYAIASGSRVSPAQFETFCRVIAVPCRPAPARIASLFEPGLVEDAFMTRELAFDATKLAHRVGAAMAASGIELRLNTEAYILGGDAHHIAVQLGPEQIRAEHVVNCTYANIEFTGIRIRARIRREMAELLLIEPPKELRTVGVTVMDGPFFSTMPFPGAALHSLSHVRYTPHAAQEHGRDPIRPTRSNRHAMLRDAARYLPALARAQVAGSLFETKTTLARNESDDGRPVLVERSATLPRVLSVLGAKIDNIYEVRAFLRAQDWSRRAAA